MTNTSVKPARSTGVAVFVGDRALAQSRIFCAILIVGGVLGGLVYRFLGSHDG